jgi:hypothetical protein
MAEDASVAALFMIHPLWWHSTSPGYQSCALRKLYEALRSPFLTPTTAKAKSITLIFTDPPLSIRSPPHQQSARILCQKDLLPFLWTIPMHRKLGARFQRRGLQLQLQVLYLPPFTGPTRQSYLQVLCLFHLLVFTVPKSRLLYRQGRRTRDRLTQRMLLHLSTTHHL